MRAKDIDLFRPGGWPLPAPDFGLKTGTSILGDGMSCFLVGVRLCYFLCFLLLLERLDICCVVNHE